MVCSKMISPKLRLSGPEVVVENTELRGAVNDLVVAECSVSQCYICGCGKGTSFCKIFGSTISAI